MPINGCSNTGTAENWDVNVVPALGTNVPTDTFKYEFTRVACSSSKIEEEFEKIKQIASEKEIELEEVAEVKEIAELEKEIQKICDLRNIKNIKLCACPDLTEEELDLLIDTCTATVEYYWFGYKQATVDCNLTVNGPNNCLAIEAVGGGILPPGILGIQTKITLDIKLTRAVVVGPVDLEFTLLDLSHTKGNIPGICGMSICKQPTRKIML